MALDNADIQIIANMVFEQLWVPRTAIDVVRDRSGEVVGGGDNLRVDSYVTPLAIDNMNNRKVDTDNIAYDDLNDDSWTLELDSRNAIAVRVSDSVLKEKPYDAMVDISRRMVEGVRKLLDDKIIGAHKGASYTANTNAFVVPCLTDSSTTAGTAAKDKWDTQNTRKNLVLACADAYGAALQAGWTTEPGWYMLVSPEVKKQLALYLVDTERIGRGQLNDDAFVDGEFRRLFGFDVITNWAGDLQGDRSKAGTGEYPMFFGIRGRTCHFAQQYSNFEALRDQRQFADLLRVLVRYGAGVQDKSRIIRVSTTFTTS